jgi:hypothetical protein
MTFTNTSIRAIGLALAAVLFAATMIAVAPSAQAADLDWGGDYFGGYGDYGGDYYGGYGDYYDYSDYGDYYGGYGDYYDYSDYSYDYPYYSDYQYDQYDYSYYTPSYSTPSYSTPSYQYPYSSLQYPSFYSPAPAPSAPSQNQNQAQSSSNSNTNTSANNNTSSSNNVNNNINNVTVNVPQAQQTVVQQFCPQGMQGVYPNCVYPQQPTYDICPNLPGVQSTLPAGYSIQNGVCQSYPTPTAPQPYVSLSQVPYTGLELGPVGTALYWGFLTLWCLIAAYLIVVKKVHNKLAAWVAGSASLSTSGSTTAPIAHVAPAVHAPAIKIAAPKATSGIDPFIQAQINRASK